MRYAFILICLCFSFVGFTQTVDNTQIDSVQIIVIEENGGYRFEAVLPPLTKIAGAPEPYWTYWWEFGDGTYSEATSPFHSYTAAQDMNVILYATRHYDDGNDVGSHHGITAAGHGISPFIDRTSSKRINLITNQEARRNQKMVLLINYNNHSSETAYGKLYLFYNQKDKKIEMIDHVNDRLHNGERLLSEEEYGSFNSESTSALSFEDRQELFYYEGSINQSIFLKPIKAEWNDLKDTPVQGQEDDFWKKRTRAEKKARINEILKTCEKEFISTRAWAFDDLLSFEDRNLFTTLLPNDDLLKDTSASLLIRGLYINEHTMDYEVVDLVLDIVNSHDPNKIIKSHQNVNFRWSDQKKVTYKILFQNTGEGPASKIKIVVSKPKEITADQIELLGNSFDLGLHSGTYSTLDTLVTKESITFLFNNVYLAGTKQKGVNDRDSTKGYISYRFGVKPVKKTPIIARANIYFDNNPPILTNKAKTSIAGWSIGLKLGINSALGKLSFPKEEGYQYFGGLTFTRFRKNRLYYQFELMGGVDAIDGKSNTGYQTLDFLLSNSNPLETQERREAKAKKIGIPVPDTGIDLTKYYGKLEGKKRRLYLDMVPLHLRRDILPFMSIGLGGQVAIEGTWIKVTKKKIPIFHKSAPRDATNMGATITLKDNKVNFAFTPSIFADVNICTPRIGPAIGARMHYHLKTINPFEDKTADLVKIDENTYIFEPISRPISPFQLQIYTTFRF